jgi:hypothetical protein
MTVGRVALDGPPAPARGAIPAEEMTTVAGGYGFGSTPSKTAAHLRRMADEIERGARCVQDLRVIAHVANDEFYLETLILKTAPMVKKPPEPLSAIARRYGIENGGKVLL